MTEQEQQDLRERAEYGRKAKIALEMLSDFLLMESANTVNHLISDEFKDTKDLLTPVITLRVLKSFELQMKHYIELGEISAKELNNVGNTD